MALHARADFECVLTDLKSQKQLIKFKATASSDLVLSADFEGGGIASNGQRFEIFTEREYDYRANAQNVIICGRKFIISAVRISFRKRMGAKLPMKKIYVLELE